MSPTTSPQASPSPAAESCTPSGASCRGSCHSLHDTCRPAMHSQQRLVATRERASVVAFSDHAQRSRRRSPRGDTAYRNGPGLVQACARSLITVRYCSAMVAARNEPPTTASTEPYDVHDRVPVCARIHPAMAREWHAGPVRPSGSSAVELPTGRTCRSERRARDSNPRGACTPSGFQVPSPPSMPVRSRPHHPVRAPRRRADRPRAAPTSVPLLVRP